MFAPSSTAKYLLFWTLEPEVDKDRPVELRQVSACRSVAVPLLSFRIKAVFGTSSTEPVAVMTYPAPRVTIAKPSRSNGVLSIAASATQKRAGPAPDGSAPRAAIARLKIIIRRLPPGLTQAEFDESVGDEWKANNGKVDWATYKPGKVSKE